VELLFGTLQIRVFEWSILKCVHAIAGAKGRPCETAFGESYPEGEGGITNFVSRGCKSQSQGKFLMSFEGVV